MVTAEYQRTWVALSGLFGWLGLAREARPRLPEPVPIYPAGLTACLCLAGFCFEGLAPDDAAQFRDRRELFGALWAAVVTGLLEAVLEDEDLVLRPGPYPPEAPAGIEMRFRGEAAAARANVYVPDRWPPPDDCLVLAMAAEAKKKEVPQ